MGNSVCEHENCAVVEVRVRPRSSVNMELARPTAATRGRCRCLLLLRRQTGDREKFNDVLERDIWHFDEVRVNDLLTSGILHAWHCIIIQQASPAAFTMRCDQTYYPALYPKCLRQAGSTRCAVRQASAPALITGRLVVALKLRSNPSAAQHQAIQLSAPGSRRSVSSCHLDNPQPPLSLFMGLDSKGFPSRRLALASLERFQTASSTNRKLPDKVANTSPRPPDPNLPVLHPDRDPT